MTFAVTEIGEKAMRLIDADVLELDMQDQWERNEICNNEWMDFRETLKRQPTIDPIKHGEWTVSSIEMGGVGVTEEKCGVCDEWSYGMGKRFCPWCGARMDGESDE